MILMRWTEEEVEFLKENFWKVSWDVLTEELGRSVGAIQRKASYLKVTKPKPKEVWTESEDDFIKENYKNMKYKEIAEILGRNVFLVQKRGRELNLDKNKYISDSSLKGLKFNSLLALERVYKNPRYWWKCRCDCGNITLVETNHLKKGLVKSCGCYQATCTSKVKIGEKYGRWTTLERTLERSSNGSVMWLCKCDCGNEKLVKAQSLSQGVSKSCGCIKKELQRAKIGSKNHNYKAFLTKEDRLQRRYMLGGTSIDKVREKVYRRDDYTCVNCQVRGGNLNSHHLNSWNAHPSGRFDVSNCVTLCVACHRNFHKKYGYGDNTKEQFEEYLKTLD